MSIHWLRPPHARTLNRNERGLWQRAWFLSEMYINLPCEEQHHPIVLQTAKTHTHTILKLVLLQIKSKSRFTDHVHCLYFLCEIKQSIVFSTVCCKLTIYKSVHVFQVCVLNTYKFSSIPTSLHPIPRNSHLIYKRIILVECSSN